MYYTFKGRFSLGKLLSQLGKAVGAWTAPFETNKLWLWTLIAIGYPNSHLHSSGIYWPIDGYVGNALVFMLQTGKSEVLD